MKNLLAALIAVCLLLPPILFARDVRVDGYFRRDGTYVRPHIRSAPNAYRWDNYGPSRSDNELMNPRLRDSDGDLTPNYLDTDDDNDGSQDDYDGSQYGRW